MWNLQFHLAFAACLRSHHLKICLKSLLLRQTERLGGIEMPKYRYMFFRIPANWSWKFLTTQMPISFQIKVPQVHLLLFLRQLKTWVFSAWGLASMSVLILNTPNPATSSPLSCLACSICQWQLFPEETRKTRLLPKTERALGVGTCNFGRKCLAL